MWSRIIHVRITVIISLKIVIDVDIYDIYVVSQQAAGWLKLFSAMIHRGKKYDVCYKTINFQWARQTIGWKQRKAIWVWKFNTRKEPSVMQCKQLIFISKKNNSKQVSKYQRIDIPFLLTPSCSTWPVCGSLICQFSSSSFLITHACHIDDRGD